MRAIAYAAATALLLTTGAAHAAYPERTVTIITPFAPGGIADVVARITAERLQSTLKQNFVVENISGAGGTAGPERVAKATPDGYTLMSTPIFQLTTAKYAHNVSFDENTFKAISGVASAPFVITVNESFPGKTLADFIAYVKANPGKLSFGSAGAGSTTHVAAVMVLKAAGLDMVHVPYRGVAPAFTDLLAGHVVMVAGSPVELKPYMESGKLKALAVLDTKPSPFLPGVPLVTDTLKDCPPAVTYNGLLGPKDLPKDVVDTLSNALVEGRKSDEFKTRFSNVGLVPLLTTSGEFEKLFAADAKIWNDIMPTLGLKKN
ncbi:Bug family tripartite tricarboxylate transporter substrate binding protein [Rhodoplanes sp. Z2-YC6860]|uniref:Bug family tripartite tricarboxylate transporter substrate binding protein n=1 Tax=Rhodoplanes sp. Z2-YC6860 TaxID=674703 RepID=UPI00078C5CB5|nr:tripartite tricarboxylate transporter substrate binding protein [Rhodoplanes sp. Z2-YC6860]AMN42333.1 ABC transporter substrate-binding protein [Rhodoplanes sp. Z2-YC6860]